MHFLFLPLPSVPSRCSLSMRITTMAPTLTHAPVSLLTSRVTSLLKALPSSHTDCIFFPISLYLLLPLLLPPILTLPPLPPTLPLLTTSFPTPPSPPYCP